MKSGFLIFILIINLIAGCSSPVTPAMNTWKVEELILFNQLSDSEFRGVSVEDLLKNEPNPKIIKDLRLQTLFQRAKFSTDMPISKGEIYAAVKLSDGTYKPLWISVYGSFFGVIGQKRRGFFRFEKDEDHKIWNELVFGASRQ